MTDKKPGTTSALAVSPKRQSALDKLPERGLAVGLTKEEWFQSLAENYDPNTEAPDFSRIKFPSGGSKKFVFPSGASTEERDTLTGVVIFHHTSRGYWPSADMTGTPPECSSINGLEGTLPRDGKQFGACATCCWNTFGSDKKGGKGKACKETRRMYLMLDGEDIPRVLSLPPGSLQSWKQFRDAQLQPIGLGLRSVMVEIGAELTKNDKGNPYAKATFRIVGRLDADSYAKVAGLHASISALAARVSVDERDYDTSGSGDRTPGDSQHPMAPFDDGPSNSAQVRAQLDAQGVKNAIRTPPAQSAPQQAIAKPAWAVVDLGAKQVVREGQVIEVTGAGYDDSGSGAMFCYITFQTKEGKKPRMMIVGDNADTASRAVRPGDWIKAVGYGYQFPNETVFRVIGNPTWRTPVVKDAKTDKDDELPF